MRTIRLTILAIALLALAPLTAAAQSIVQPGTSVLFWDHDGSGPPTHFEAEWDGGAARVRVGDYVAGTVTYSTQFPALTQGTHTVRIFACAAEVCTPSAPFSFVVTVQPGPPTNIRIGTAGTAGAP